VRSFTAAAIHQYAPAASGIYGLSNAREWIYIGETDNIQAKLLEHRGEQDTTLLRREPKGFMFELCVSGMRSFRRQALVRELRPVL
jgi:hypothetical protein